MIMAASGPTLVDSDGDVSRIPFSVDSGGNG